MKSRFETAWPLAALPLAALLAVSCSKPSFFNPRPPVPPPGLAVTGVVPPSGPETGGTLVTLSGTDFTAGAAVSVAGLPCNAVQVVSATILKCQTPSHPPGSATVTVTEPGGASAALSAAFTFLGPTGSAPVVSGTFQSSPSISARTGVNLPVIIQTGGTISALVNASYQP